MEEVGKLIRDGAFTFLKREYRILGIFSAVVVVLIVLFFPEPIWHGNAGKNIQMAIVYLFGTALSGLAGYVGISIATVSYTHLDVYKRQFPMWAAALRLQRCAWINR